MAHTNPYERRRHQREYQQRWNSNPANREQHRARVKVVRHAEKDWRRALVRQLKSQPCMDCGGIFDYECMDFDHREGVEKLGLISKMADGQVARAVFLAEIAKCDVVCANCHRLRSKARRGPDFGLRRQRPTATVKPLYVQLELDA